MKFLREVALLFFAAALPAHALYVNPDGHGQALIFPYYTAQSANGNPYNTYITIANRDGVPKALRVRVREGRNGREVASFNLYLNARAPEDGPAQSGDVWAAAIVPTNIGPAIVTRDSSCTHFHHDFSASPPTLHFSNASFTGANADTFGNDAERLAEGYIEVFEMGTLATRASCSALLALPPSAAAPPTGGLSGTLTVINVANGTDFTVNAVALQDVATQSYYRADASAYPDWDAAEVNRVAAFVQDGKMYRSTWPSGVGALDAVLMQSVINNEVVLDAATASSTDWVFTFPTKRYHTGTTPTPPFTPGLLQGRDVPLRLNFATREGEATTYVDGCGFLCPGNTIEADIRLRWASSVLAFRPSGSPASAGTSDALGSRNSWGLALPPGARNGSAQVSFGGFGGTPSMTFTAAATRISDGALTNESVRIDGLPLLGFMVRTFQNGTLTCTGASCQGNYGGSFPHKYTRTLGP